MEQKTTNNPNKKKPSFGAIVADHKAEFKKIVWPAREDVAKKTATVLVVSLIMSVIIVAYDAVFSGALDLAMTAFGLI